MKTDLSTVYGGKPYILKAKAIHFNAVDKFSNVNVQTKEVSLSSNFFVYGIYSMVRWRESTVVITNLPADDESDTPIQKSDYRDTHGGFSGRFPDGQLFSGEEGIDFQAIGRIVVDLETYDKQKEAPINDALYGRLTFPIEPTWTFLPAGFVIPGNIPFRIFFSAHSPQIPTHKVIAEIDMYGLLEGDI